MNPPESDLFERLKSIGSVAPTAPLEGSPIVEAIEKKTKDHSAPVTIRNLFTHLDTHPIVLDFALLRAFGVQWYGWDTPTIWQEIQRVFESPPISEHNRAKIQTVKTVHVSHGPWSHWQVFEKIIQGLNGNVPRFDLIQPPSLNQLYAGVDILNEIHTDEFDSEVKLYMAAVVLHEEVFYVPPPLQTVQTEVSQPHYRCLDCENEEVALFHDGICDTCSEKFDAEQGLSMRPKSDLTERGVGTNTQLILRYDPDPVQQRWLGVEHTPTERVKLEETATDIQIGKLLEARDYMNVKRKQLAEQLVALRSWLETA